MKLLGQWKQKATDEKQKRGEAEQQLRITQAELETVTEERDEAWAILETETQKSKDLEEHLKLVNADLEAWDSKVLVIEQPYHALRAADER